MATVAIDFIHYDRTHVAGDEIPDDDPLVAGAPHLFVQPDPVLEPEPDPELRIRVGPLVNDPKSRKR